MIYVCFITVSTYDLIPVNLDKLSRFVTSSKFYQRKSELNNIIALSE